jgi:hypothetical protein
MMGWLAWTNRGFGQYITFFNYRACIIHVCLYALFKITNHVNFLYSLLLFLAFHFLFNQNRRFKTKLLLPNCEEDISIIYFQTCIICFMNLHIKWSLLCYLSDPFFVYDCSKNRVSLWLPEDEFTRNHHIWVPFMNALLLLTTTKQWVQVI